MTPRRIDASMRPGAGPGIRMTVAHRRGSRAGRYLQRLAGPFLRRLGQTGAELSISIVTDAAIRKLNAKWRDQDKATDVLSFPAGDMPKGTPGPKLLGDVVISLDTAKRQAKELRRPLQEELARYLAHGILHLLGHDHERASDARRMAKLENALLGTEGMIRRAGMG